MTSRDPKRAFATLPSDPDTWVRTPEPATSQNGAKADLFTARMSREFPDDAGGTA